MLPQVSAWPCAVLKEGWLLLSLWWALTVLAASPRARPEDSMAVLPVRGRESASCTPRVLPSLVGLGDPGPCRSDGPMSGAD